MEEQKGGAGGEGDGGQAAAPAMDAYDFANEVNPWK